MDTKMIMIVAVVAIVAVAAGGAYVVMSDSDNDGTASENTANKESVKLTDFPCRLNVLGNANLDDYINSEDVTYVENLIAEGDIDYTKEFMCDVNFDGYINQTDVDLLKKMPTYGVDTVYYVNVDYKITSFNMDTPNKNVCTLISPPLDTVLVLNGDLVKGVDNRETTGYAKDRYADILDLKTIVDVGSCNEPDKEALAKLLEQNDGCITVVCGSTAWYGPTMETDFAGTGLQVVRIPSWEGNKSIEGLLTLGYLLEEMTSAYTYLDWFDGIEEKVVEIAESVAEAKRPVGMVYYNIYEDHVHLLGGTSGENANLEKITMNVIMDDIYADCNTDPTKTDHVEISNEEFAEYIEDYDVTYIFSDFNAPFSPTTAAEIKEMYDKEVTRFGSALNGVNFIFIAGEFNTGVSKILNLLFMAEMIYPDEFAAANVDLKTIVNEYSAFLGHDTTVFGYDNMNLVYAGEGSSLNVLNKG